MTRIVITGMGAISALGRSCADLGTNLLEGRNGIGPIAAFDAAGFNVQVAAEVRGYRAEDHFDDSRAAQMDRFAQFAVLSAREAMFDAGLAGAAPPPSRVAVVHGTGVGGQGTHDDAYRLFYAEKARRLPPLTVPKLMPAAAACHISLDLGVTGPVFSVSSACASSAHAIATAAMMLRAGLADIVLAGGSEACITPGAVRAWEGLRVMAKDACRPFSKGRGGMVLGEGAATLVLETLDHARARGARIHAELAGVGMSSDARSLIQPDVGGIAACIRAALDDARAAPDAVDYINAHGTGTAQNDPAESRAIHDVFGARGSTIPVSSSKSMLGHTLGAAAALEAIATIVAIREQTAPPTIGFRERDPLCDVDCVPNVARPMPIAVALSHSFAFGGLNVALALRREPSF
jgi:nodulation protein E